MFGFFLTSSNCFEIYGTNPRNRNQTKAHAKVDHIMKQNLSIQQTHAAKCLGEYECGKVKGRTPSCTRPFERVQTTILDNFAGRKRVVVTVMFVVTVRRSIHLCKFRRNLC